MGSFCSPVLQLMKMKYVSSCTELENNTCSSHEADSPLKHHAVKLKRLVNEESVLRLERRLYVLVELSDKSVIFWSRDEDIQPMPLTLDNQRSRKNYFHLLFPR